MFSPVIVVCAAWFCITEVPPVAYETEERCLIEGAIISGMVSTDIPPVAKKRIKIACGSKEIEFNA